MVGRNHNVGPYQYTYNKRGCYAGFDPIMKMSRRRTKKREDGSAGERWDHRRDPTYIDGKVNKNVTLSNV